MEETGYEPDQFALIHPGGAVKAAGADATGTTSGIMLAKDPEAMLNEMMSVLKRARDEMH